MIPMSLNSTLYLVYVTTGFRFLVMERMASPLKDAVPILLQSRCKNKVNDSAVKIPLGDLAVAMLNCIQAMHESNNLVVDVKPENFMLSSSTSSTKSGKSNKPSSSDLSQRIRLIDFGLVERYGDMSSSKHREDEHPGAPLVGTPSYASLNVMSGHTVSRRDDLEALGYVISELVFLLMSSGSGNNNSASRQCGAKSANMNNEALLPWGNASSDDELLRIKMQEMDESKRSSSRFFIELKAAGVGTVMSNYFSIVQRLGYSEKPDYELLKHGLKQLVVSFESCSVNTTGIKDTSSSPLRRKNNPPAETEGLSAATLGHNLDNAKSSGKRQKITNAVVRTRKHTREIATQTENDVNEEREVMDWETLDDENVAPASDRAQGKCILRLEVIDGPHDGQVFSIGGDHPGTIIIGKDPSSNNRGAKDAFKLALSKDSNASSVHAKLVLTSVRNKVHSIRVTDMSSTVGTFINGGRLPKGKSRQAFIGDKIKIGESLFQIKKA